ncbi:response regulator [Luteimonas sp. BDR2-5]|uniref:response regulator n=1 Tax=Proluteimonas luteida TaxID=2878685 RepID=UPI001E623765|nr:response regulator [Luteimonas sp. BDR2-5]MCD9029168.1 response regulator [Luteimonas sp. BDR2-5]
MNLQTPILVVDDDPGLRSLIATFLAEHGYPVRAVANVQEMREQIARFQPHLVILDVMMPGEDGLSAARRLASENGPAVIMLSALGTDTDRIIGLEVGADDYLAKPCNPRELLARVRAVLRRRQSAAAAPAGGYHFAGWHLEPARRELRTPDGRFVNLSDGEFSLLRTFVEHPQRVLSRNQLLDYARGQDSSEVYDRAIDSQVSRLRRKIHDCGHGELIRTVRNEGYMLLPPVVRG